MNTRQVVTLALVCMQALIITSCGKKCHPRVSKMAQAPLCTQISPALLPKKDQPITIFVHGTRTLTSLVSQMPSFTHNMSSHCGISCVTEVSDSFLFARLARVLSKADPKQFPLENIYLYGWSGALKFTARKQAAQRLAAFIQAVRNHKPSKNAPITIITHSHGGNVALNLAAVDADYSSIDRLILLACPVQEATKQLVLSPLFKKVLHFYSTADMFQILDLQGLYDASNTLHAPLLSERQFPHGPTIVQATLRNRGSSLSHIDFITQRFMQQLPHFIALLDDPISRQILPMRTDGSYSMRINLTTG